MRKLLFLLITCFVASLTACTKSKNDSIQATESEKVAAMPQYRANREAPKPLAKIENPRFELNNGVYVNSKSVATNEATIMLTGDLMSVSRQQKAALRLDSSYNFNGGLKLVKQIFNNADLVVGNLETQLSESYTYTHEYPRSANGSPICNAPATYLDALRYAGFDALATANNHSCDAGAKGIIQTLGHLNDYRFMHTGTFEKNTDVRHLLVDVKGIKIGILSYTQLKYNGRAKYLTTEQQIQMLNTYSKERLEKDLKNIRKAGAEFVIVYIHWGKQNSPVTTELQKATAKELAEAGVDIIIGSHPHVLQQYDEIATSDGHKVPVFYSMGNFYSSMSSVDGNRNTIVIELNLKKELTKINIQDISYIPCRILDKYEQDDFVVYPLSENAEDKYIKQSIKETMGSLLQEKSCI
ncbi:MAG: CapA family protein [Dysgonamonadaceae bacterium]|nr:CapA family protein [Dysgonamonadaceae bacterium]